MLKTLSDSLGTIGIREGLTQTHLTLRNLSEPFLERLFFTEPIWGSLTQSFLIGRDSRQ